MAATEVAFTLLWAITKGAFPRNRVRDSLYCHSQRAVAARKLRLLQHDMIKKKKLDKNVPLFPPSSSGRAEQ